MQPAASPDALNPVYLDHNASTPLLPEALEAMLPHLRGEFGNPSSGHVYGLRARDAVEKARSQVAHLLGANPWEIYFTGGGTEANNLGIRGAARAHRQGRRTVVTTCVEHAAVTAPCEMLAAEGFTLLTLPVTPEGVVREDAWRSAVDGSVALVSVMHANNEVGTLQPVRAIADHARPQGVVVHADAAQSVGKTDVKVDALGVDLLTLAAHKFYGPKGVGALYVRAGTPIQPLVAGAGHERGLRPGTENVAGVVGMGVAAERAAADLAAEASRLETLRDRLARTLAERVPGLRINGHPTARLCNTLNVSFPGVRGADVIRLAGDLAASTGSACHGDEESGVLAAMGLPPEQVRGAVRLSLGRLTGEAQISHAISSLLRGFKAAVQLAQTV